LIGSHKTLLATVIAFFLVSGVLAATYGKISTCDATPLCIIAGNSSDQPTLIEPASEETKETYDGVKENTSASWLINATGPRRYVNVTVLGEVPSNPNVADVRGDEHRKEIQIKGLIPETDTVGHPFFMANKSSGSTYKNPQVLPANNNEFRGSETFGFDGLVNVSNAPQRSEWTVFMFANSTNPNVKEKRSDNGTIRIAGPVTNQPPRTPNVTTPANQTRFEDNNTVTINATVEDPDGDNMTVTLRRQTPTTEKQTKQDVVNGSQVSFTNIEEQGVQRFTITASDGQGNTTTSQRVFTVDTTAPDIIGGTRPTITYPVDWQGIDYNATDVGTDTYVWSQTNTEDFTIGVNGFLDDKETLGAGNHTTNITVEDDEGDTNTTSVVLDVEKATPSLDLNATNTTYPQNTKVDATANNIGDNDVTYQLLVDGTTRSTGEDIDTELDVSGGSHTVTYKALEGQNYTTNTVQETINVEKATTSTDLLFETSLQSVRNQDLSLNEGATLNITADTNVSIESQVTPSTLILEADTTRIGIIDGNNRTITSYQPTSAKTITAEYLGNENYTASTQTQSLNINEKPEIRNLTVRRKTSSVKTYEFNVSDDKQRIDEATGLPEPPETFTNQSLAFNTTDDTVQSTISIEDESQLSSDVYNVNVTVSTTNKEQARQDQTNFTNQYIEQNTTLTNNGDQRLRFNAEFTDQGQLLQETLLDPTITPATNTIKDRAVWKRNNLTVLSTTQLAPSTEKIGIGLRFPADKNITVENTASIEFSSVNTSTQRPPRCQQTQNKAISVSAQQVSEKTLGYNCLAAQYLDETVYDAQRNPFFHRFTREINISRNATDLVWKLNKSELPQYDSRINETVFFNDQEFNASITVSQSTVDINIGERPRGNATLRYEYGVDEETQETISTTSSTSITQVGQAIRVDQPSPLLSQVEGQDSTKITIENTVEEENTVNYALQENCQGLSIQRGDANTTYGKEGTLTLAPNAEETLNIREASNNKEFRLLDSCTVEVEPTTGGFQTLTYRESPIIFTLIGPLGLVLAAFSVWRIGIKKTLRILAWLTGLVIVGIYEWRLSLLIATLFAAYNGIRTRQQDKDSDE